MRKKLISILICLVVVLSSAFVSLTAEAVVTIDEGDYTFAVNGNGTFVIYKYNGTETDLELPADLNGNPVVGIYNYCFSESDLTSVVIPEGYTSIGNSAFLNSASLASVSFPSTLNKVGDYAFAGCTSLASADLSQTEVVKIPLAMFLGDSSLETVLLPDSVTEIGERAFAYCGALNAFELPESLRSIGDGGFRNSNIDGLYVPPTVTWIGKNAFDSITGSIMCIESSACGAYCVENNLTNSVIRLLGDVNNDGEVNISDVTAIQKHLLGKTPIEDELAVLCADVSHDDNIGIRDATLIQMKIAGIILSF